MKKDNEFLREIVNEIAKMMAIAARTAPKTRGVDNIEVAVADNQTVIQIADKMEEIAERENQAFFERDAKNLRNSNALLLIGVRINPAELQYCGLCGMKNCETKRTKPEIPCAFNTIDLGIAVSSAVNVAMNHRVDNRIMYTIGMATKEIKVFDKDLATVLGIPLSAKGKNIYFDRK